MLLTTTNEFCQFHLSFKAVHVKPYICDFCTKQHFISSVYAQYNFGRNIYANTNYVRKKEKDTIDYHISKISSSPRNKKKI